MVALGIVYELLASATQKISFHLGFGAESARKFWRGKVRENHGVPSSESSTFFSSKRTKIRSFLVTALSRPSTCTLRQEDPIGFIDSTALFDTGQ